MKITVKRRKYIVRYHHHFPYRTATTCFIQNARGQTIGEGFAECSEKDNYCKATGKKVALTKALRNMSPESKEDRAAFWQAIWKEREMISQKKWTV